MDEVYQDVCLRLVKMPEDKLRFNSYLCQSIINEINVQARFRLRGIHLRNPIPVHTDDDGNEEQMEFPAPSEYPQSECRIFLEQIIQELRPEYAEVIRLISEGYTHAEIAEMFGKTAGWVNMIVQAFRKSRAKAQARKGNLLSS